MHCSRSCSRSSALLGGWQHLLRAGIRLLAQHGDGGGCTAAAGPHRELVFQLHLLFEGFIVRSELFYRRPEGHSRQEGDKLWGGDFESARQMLTIKRLQGEWAHLCLMKNCCVSANTLCSALAIQQNSRCEVSSPQYVPRAEHDNGLLRLTGICLARSVSARGCRRCNFTSAQIVHVLPYLFPSCPSETPGQGLM